MTKQADTDQEYKVSKDSRSVRVEGLITSGAEHNNSGSASNDETLRPKTLRVHSDVYGLETFSLADFVELIDAAGAMPTGKEKVLSAEEVATSHIEIDESYLQRLRNSRFGFLVEHLYSGDRLIRDIRLEARSTDPIGLLDSYAIAGVLNFLLMAHSLFFHILASKRRNTRIGLKIVPITEPRQHFFSSFTMCVPAYWSVRDNGRLRRLPFPAERDITWRLVNRFLKLLDGADPARVRRCAFVNCQKVFYAKRLDQLCCSRRCNNNRLQREWYEKHGKSAVYARASRRENKR